VTNGGLKVITTLDYDMQQKAEIVVNEYALENEVKFNASNAGLVAIDPTTGQILAMVGSRDYFDKKIDGNFNVTLAHRQPGSSFKPFVYATAFEKGYTPDTVLFDLPTQFSTYCDATGKPLSPGTPSTTCYMPQNYDGEFKGPISLRNALAQSRNIPSIKLLYLAGITDSIQTARDMGITSLADKERYGLTLVLGGGEVSPLEMTSAYGVFANNGVRNPYNGVLSVVDKTGKTLEQFTANPTQVIPEQTALTITNVLSDNNARLALNGPGSATDFPGREVALKTGTTNDYRDVWILGYTPQVVVGAWAGNNNNSAMIHKTSGLIIAPLWRAFMDQILPTYPSVSFKRPDPPDPSLKPILRGVWQGGQTYTIDKSTGKLATDMTPPDLRQEVAMPNVHSILYWVDKNNPTGPPPAHPENDPQFKLWDPPIQAWLARNQGQFTYTPPTQTDDVHTSDAQPQVMIISPNAGASIGTKDKVVVNIGHQNKFPLQRAEFYVNNTLIGTANQEPFSLSFVPETTQNISTTNTLKVIVSDQYENKGEATVQFTVR
jgi:membrane peptidoglycan carboxypeptidase